MTARRHIHLDAVGGIAGDMFVAALLDAFPELRPRVLADIAAVLPRDCGRAELAEGMSGGLRTLRFGLVATDAAAEHKSGTAGSHATAHRNPRSLPASPSSSAAVAVADRISDATAARDGSYRALVALIRRAPLAAGTADAAEAILTHLANVEAHIHDVQRDDVHFHELADWDSLMDVVAAGSIAAALHGTRWSVSDLPLGGGQVMTAHGRLPVPAPATIELLRGYRWRDDGIAGERVTPTGAAILRHLVAPDESSPLQGRLAATGTGAGTRELRGTPNVLRALVFDLAAFDSSQRVAVVSFEVDDMTGEEIGVAADRLRAESGVHDVSLSIRIGKKGRPMTSFRLLVDPAALEAVQQHCFSETSTIGLRWHVEQRTTLARRMETVVTDESTVRVKRVVRPSGESTCKAESDDLQAVEGLQARRARKARSENGPK